MFHRAHNRVSRRGAARFKPFRILIFLGARKPLGLAIGVSGYFEPPLPSKLADTDRPRLATRRIAVLIGTFPHGRRERR